MPISQTIREYYGLSTDTKPVVVDTGIALPTGSKFVEVNTGDSYRWNGTAWIADIITSGSSGDIPPLDANGGLPVSLVTRLDLANDAVQARIITGTYSDAAGGSITVKTKRFTASSSGNNQVLAAVSGKKFRILSYSLQNALASGASVSAKFMDAAGTPIQMTQLWGLAVGGGISKPLSSGPGFYFETSIANVDLNLNLSGAQTVEGEIVYLEV